MTPALELASFRVEPGAAAGLGGRDPSDTAGLVRKADVANALRHERRRIAVLQPRLYAEGRRSLLVVLQAMDTGGKDGTIRNVLSGVNPQGCQVVSFKAPSQEELARARALVRRAGRPEVVPEPCGRLRHRRDPGGDGPSAARAGAGTRGPHRAGLAL